MQFVLIDRITEIKPGHSITATKSLSLAEEYLQDHFPRFPVMPGVLMLEAMFQAATWLIYKTSDFATPVVLLKEAGNVKFSDFVQPGQTLTVTAEVTKHHGNLYTMKTKGLVGEKLAVGAKLVIEATRILDLDHDRQASDAYCREKLRQRYELLYRP